MMRTRAPAPLDANGRNCPVPSATIPLFLSGNSMKLPQSLVLVLLAGLGASSAWAQTEPALEVQGTLPGPPATEHIPFEVKQDGAFVARGFVRDVGNTTGCAPFIPATGAGTRFMWHPCRGSLRFGRVPAAQTNWDDANMDDFTFAGGNQVTASGYGAFAFGDQVTASATVGVGFGSGVTVSGTAGFSAGASNVCSGFACTAIGYTTMATGQGAVAIGYRTYAMGDYNVALGYRAQSCSGTVTVGTTPTCSGTIRTGTFTWGDESTTTFLAAQADNEFRIRANGGVRLRVSTAANGNTPGAGGNVGCDLTVAVPSWTCASSRTVKKDFEAVEKDALLARLQQMPVTTWNFEEGQDGVRHLGPVAEDFYAAFGLGESESSIMVQDMAGVGLAGVQALADRTDAMSERIAALEAQNTALRAELEASRNTHAAMMSRLEGLEAIFPGRQHVAASSD